MLLKKGTLDPHVLGNYRPVSNLSFLSKFLEKEISKGIDLHKSLHQLYDPFSRHIEQGTVLRLPFFEYRITLCARSTKESVFSWYCWICV